MENQDLYLAETALIIVDAQNMWFNAQGKMSLPDAIAQISTIAELAQYFRKHNGSVIYTRVVWDNDSEVPLPLKRARPLFEQDKTILRRGTFGSEICLGLAPQPEDIIVDKKYFDAFQTGNLAEVLQPQIKNLAFAGTTLNNCVYSTLLSASQRGYHTIAVRDCISAFPGENVESWYKQMQDNLGTQVVTAKRLIELLT